MRLYGVSHLFILSLLLLCVAGCVPGSEGFDGGEIAADISNSGTAEMSGDALAQVTSATAEADDATPFEGTIVDNTTAATTEPGNEAPGESPPGAGTDDDPGQVPPAGALSPGAGELVYSDSEFGFSFAYPDGFVIRPMDITELAQYQPSAAQSLYIMNPDMAAGDLAGVEPPDLALNVYAAEPTTLEGWLMETGLIDSAGGTIWEPATTNGRPSIKVCQTTMAVPDCAFFVTAGGYVYQLIPLTMEGEAIMGTFTLAE